MATRQRGFFNLGRWRSREPGASAPVTNIVAGLQPERTHPPKRRDAKSAEKTRVAASPHCSRPTCSHVARISGAGLVAKRLECVELAPAVEWRRSLKAGASSTHSKRFARFG